MTQTAFEPSYTGVTKDGAEWIVKRGDIRLVGIDYLSVALYEDLVGPHIALLTDVSFPRPDGSTALHCMGPAMDVKYGHGQHADGIPP